MSGCRTGSRNNTTEVTGCSAVASAVLDTNVFVGAGFNPRSSSARLLDLVAAREVSLLWSAATKRETAFILRRIPRLSWEKVEPLFRPEGVCSADLGVEKFDFIVDPDDRKFAALAAAARAPLVSSDNHLLEHRGRSDLSIVTPRQFLVSLRMI